MAKTKAVQGRTPGKGGVAHGIKKLVKKPKNPKVQTKLDTWFTSKSPAPRKVLGDRTNKETTARLDDEQVGVKKLEDDEIKMETTEEDEESASSPEESDDDFDPKTSNKKKKKGNVSRTPEADKKKPITSILSDDLCEYEKIRHENIRQREAMFAELDFEEAKMGVTPEIQRSATGPSKRGLQPVKKEKEVLPRRQSSRLAGGKVPEIERFVPMADPEVPEAPEIPERTLTLEEFGEPECSSLLTSVASSTATLSKSGKQDLAGLTISPEGVAKVVPERIFSIAVHPGHEKVVAAAGDKRGNIGLWDCEDRESASHGVHLLRYHSRPVNCLTWDMAQSHLLISTSYDGTMRQLDVTKQECSLVYHDPAFLDAGGWCSSHCQPDENTFLISQQGGVAKVDRRVGTVPVSTFDLFEKILAKSLSCHSNAPHMLMAGTNKGGCFIFDLRSTSKKNKLLDPVTELLGASRSLSSCQFSPNGKQAVTLSYDDKLRLYNTEAPGASLMPCAQVRHNNQTGRWLTPFRASWHPDRENMFATGSMERPRQIELWSSEGGKLAMSARLRGEDFGSVASIVAFHPTRDAIVGGNSSGRLHLFQ